MLTRLDAAIDGLVRRIGYDAKTLCDRIESIADEDDFTSRIAQDIERSINGQWIGGVRFTANTKKLKWRGKDSEEPILGADLMLVVRMHAGKFDVSKGYLIQAKMNMGSPSAIRVGKPRQLSAQIDDMLAITSDAYVWAYSGDGIAVARAGSFKSALGAGIAVQFEPQTFTGFFRGALRSHSGDYNLRAKDAGELGQLAKDIRAKRLLLISGEVLDGLPLRRVRFPGRPG